MTVVDLTGQIMINVGKHFIEFRGIREEFKIPSESIEYLMCGQGHSDMQTTGMKPVPEYYSTILIAFFKASEVG